MAELGCPTVMIDDGHGGFIIINKEDFNEDLHELYDGPVPEVSNPVKEGENQTDGEQIVGGGQDSSPDDDDEEKNKYTEPMLHRLLKDDVLAIAGGFQLELAPDATKQDIIDAILKFQDGENKD